MIGGTDLVFKSARHVCIADVAYRASQSVWRHFVVQNEDEETPPYFEPICGSGFRFPRARGYFIYRDVAAAISWREHGGIEENVGGMFYAIEGKRDFFGPGMDRVTIVCGRRDDESGKIAVKIGRELELMASEPPMTSEAA